MQNSWNYSRSVKLFPHRHGASEPSINNMNSTQCTYRPSSICDSSASSSGFWPQVPSAGMEQRAKLPVLLKTRLGCRFAHPHASGSLQNAQLQSARTLHHTVRVIQTHKARVLPADLRYGASAPCHSYETDSVRNKWPSQCDILLPAQCRTLPSLSEHLSGLELQDRADVPMQIRQECPICGRAPSGNLKLGFIYQIH